MNSNLNRALTAALIAFGGVAPALAQYEWDGACTDPNNSAPYSPGLLVGIKENALFGAGIGYGGTVAYASQCESATAPNSGRIGFTIGPTGSIQDTQDPAGFGGLTDNFLRLTRGTNFGEGIRPNTSYIGAFVSPSTGGNSYARVFVRTTGATPTTTSYFYGSLINLAFAGPRSRYVYTEGLVNGNTPTNAISVRCVIDVLADAARVNWRLTNRLANNQPVGLGLWFGQIVQLKDVDGFDHLVPFGDDGFPLTYVTVPGRRPLTVEERFTTTGPPYLPDPLQDATLGVPPYVNFSMGQRAGFGLQVVNNPTALQGFDPTAVIDQTPVDEFTFGSAPFIIDGHFGTVDPGFGDFIFNAAGRGIADAAFVDPIPAYVQKWLPDNTIVAPGAFRDIISYYRSTSGDSSYSPSFQGYAATVDTPKAISTNPDDPSTFNQNPFTIRVNVDNTGGFSNNDALVQMQSVQVVLNLPNGMHAPGSTSRTITKTVNRVYQRNGIFYDEVANDRIAPAGIGFVDFQVVVDENTFGALPYTVQITPQPGFATKTINGTINVATTPRLNIVEGANLVSPPWEFADNAWESVLNLDLNGDFRAYTWDAQVQQYVTQTAAERGRGTFIISNPDPGFIPLGGSPKQPTDQFPEQSNYDVGGAPLVRLYRGWNLVGNPYNYAFPLGQIIGVPNGNGNLALSYADLISQGYTDGSFAFYDQSLRSYNYISTAQGRLQPNFGYWIYANFDFDIQFPPLYELFIRSAQPKPQAQRYNNWRLQLSATTPKENDTENFVGIVKNPTDETRMAIRKAPMAPVKNAIRAYTLNGNREMAQYLRNSYGKQTFTYKVHSKAAGPVTISWPNLKEIPGNLAITVVDNDAKKTVNARSVAGYSYTAKAETIRTFTITATPQGTVAQRVGSASATAFKMGNLKAQKVNVLLSGRGSVSIRVLQNGKSLGTVVNDADAVAGNNTFVWTQVGGNGVPLPDGNYVLEIAAQGEGGDTTTRQLGVTVRN